MRALVIFCDEFGNRIAVVIWNELQGVQFVTTLYIVSYDVFDNAFVCFVGMVELILVENFVHCGFFGVSGVGRIMRFRGGCLWGHIMAISSRGDWRNSRQC